MQLSILSTLTQDLCILLLKNISWLKRNYKLSTVWNISALFYPFWRGVWIRKEISLIPIPMFIYFRAPRRGLVQALCLVSSRYNNPRKDSYNGNIIKWFPWGELKKKKDLFFLESWWKVYYLTLLTVVSYFKEILPYFSVQQSVKVSRLGNNFISHI